MSTVRDLIGLNGESEYLDFNLEEVKQVLSTLAVEVAVDLPQSENLQRLSLRGADILSDYLGQIVKTIGVLDAKLTRTKNNALINFEPPKGVKPTADVRKAGAEADPEVEKLSISLSEAKAARFALEKKYDILIRAHHYYKDISAGFKRTIGVGNDVPKTEQNGAVGWS